LIAGFFHPFAYICDNIFLKMTGNHRISSKFIECRPQRGPLRAPEVSVLVIGVCSFSGAWMELGGWNLELCAPPRRSAGILPAGSGGILPPVVYFQTASHLHDFLIFF
jgi:hypothetical protein